jgi:hypothetical protein
LRAGSLGPSSHQDVFENVDVAATSIAAATRIPAATTGATARTGVENLTKDIERTHL